MSRKSLLNWQVGVILALTMVALAAPIACVVIFGKGYFDARKQAAASPVAEVPGIREKMEMAADAHLSEQTLGDERPLIRIPCAAASRKALLENHAIARGATVLELEPNERFLVSGPTGTLAAMSSASGLMNPPSLPTGDEFFEILFTDPQ